MDAFTTAGEPGLIVLLEQLSAEDRGLMRRNLALSVDRENREILVGLHREESEWVLAFVNRGKESRVGEDGDRYLKLYEAHERARASLLEARGRPANDD
jgi:hypothetical protein